MFTILLLYSLFSIHYSTFAAHAATSSATATVPQTPATPSDTTSPTIPILIAPLDEATLDNSSPTFTWRRSSDPQSNTVIYSLSLNGEVTYTNIVDQGNSITPSYTTRQEGTAIHLTPSYALADGPYTWYVSASDPSGNTARSATWNFTLDTAYPALTSTVAQLQTTRYELPLLLYILLALILSILPINLWYKRRYNLILLDSSLRPLSHVTLYHSNPHTHSLSSIPLSSIPLFSIQHSLFNKLYIPRLSRFSTLTIINPAGPAERDDSRATYVMSICASRRLYTIVLG